MSLPFAAEERQREQECRSGLVLAEAALVLEALRCLSPAGQLSRVWNRQPLEFQVLARSFAHP